jgi:hypothetical protein
MLTSTRKPVVDVAVLDRFSISRPSAEQHEGIFDGFCPGRYAG